MRSTTSTAAGSSTTHRVGCDTESLYDIDSSWIRTRARWPAPLRQALQRRSGRATGGRRRPRTAGHRTARRLQLRRREPGRYADEPSLRNGRALARARTRFAGRSGRGAAQKRSNCFASRHIGSAPWTTSPSPAAFKTCLCDTDRLGVQDPCWPGLAPSSSVLAGHVRAHKPWRARPGVGRQPEASRDARRSSWDKSTTTTASSRPSGRRPEGTHTRERQP